MRFWHKSSGRIEHERGIEVRNTQDSGVLWCSLERFPALFVGRVSPDASLLELGTRHTDTGAQRERQESDERSYPRRSTALRHTVHNAGPTSSGRGI